jgi:hypothetical protein
MPANPNLVVQRLILVELVENYKSFLCNHVASYSLDDFIYREFALAIFSFAAGGFLMLKADEVELQRHRGSIVIGLTLTDIEVDFFSAHKLRDDAGGLHVGSSAG